MAKNEGTLFVVNVVAAAATVVLAVPAGAVAYDAAYMAWQRFVYGDKPAITAQYQPNNPFVGNVMAAEADGVRGDYTNVIAPYLKAIEGKTPSKKSERNGFTDIGYYMNDMNEVVPRSQATKLFRYFVVEKTGIVYAYVIQQKKNPNMGVYWKESPRSAPVIKYQMGKDPTGVPVWAK